MNDKALRRYEYKAQVFKALSHPIRILILDKLKDKNWCVCELADEIGVEKSLVSKHLSQLKAVGLVDDRRSGTCVEYRLLAPCILEMAACAEATVMEHRRKSLEEIQ